MSSIKARMILEILGRPKEHIVEALSSLVEKMEKDDGLKVLEKKIHEPIEVQDAKDLFTTFAEVLVDMKDLEGYWNALFKYMPANVEIISPESIQLTSNSLNFAGNKLMARLHEYDAIAKTALQDRQMLIGKLREVAPHLFKKPEQQENLEDKAAKPKVDKLKSTTKASKSKSKKTKK